jgi:hypothetical protein
MSQIILDNSIQVIDLIERKIAGRIFLGGSQIASAPRRGEAIFYDAKRSLDQWYSCHSCHYLGGSNAVAMDTFNDGTAFTFKTVLPLYTLDRTGPWTWHGWQKGLIDAMEHSPDKVNGQILSREETLDLIVYLKTL